MLPGVEKAQVKSRIILTPEHAKRLLRSLQENIVRYESAMGKIEIPVPQPAPDGGPKMGRPESGVRSLTGKCSVGAVPRSGFVDIPQGV